MCNIVVIRLGAVGDVVLTLGVIASVRNAYPNAQLTVVTRPLLAPLVASHPSVTHVLSTPQKESALALALRIRRLRPHIVIDLQGKLRALLLKVLSGARRHIIWGGRPMATRIRHHLGGAPAHPARLQTEASYRAAEKAVGHTLLRLKPALHVSAREEAVASQLWHETVAPVLGRSAVVLSPGAQWATKRWPLAHYVTLARLLIEAGYSVVVVGSQSEVLMAKGIAKQVPQVVSLSGRLDLASLASFLRRASLMICGDTGPLHIARAVGCRTIGLFGSTSPEAFDPGEDLFLAKPPACAPCSFHGRPSCPLGTLRCLEELSPIHVAQTALALLRKIEATA